MVTREAVLEKLSENAERLKQNFSVTKLGLFGSFARNEPSPQSDLDILVVFAEPTFDHYMDLKFYLEKLFQTSVDLVIADNLKPRLKPQIEKEVVYAKGL